MRTIVLSVILVLSTPAALAVSQHKHNIKGFEDLDIGTGIRATVVCGDKNQVVVDASEHLLSAVQVKVRDGLLSINRNFSFSDLFDHHHSRDVLVTVTTTRALSDLDVSTGSILYVASCAVAHDSLDVRVGTGGSALVAGQTDSLVLRVGTGGSFNMGRYRDELDVNRVDVRLSAGGEVGPGDPDK